MPLTLFKVGGAGGLTRAELENFPKIVKGVVHSGELFTDTLDGRVYTGGKGRQWRQPNVLRPNGKYKVQVMVDELCSMTADSYAAITTEPRPLLKVGEAEFCPRLGALWDASASASAAIKKAARTVSVAPVDDAKIARVKSVLDCLHPDDSDDESAHHLRLQVLQAVHYELGRDEGLPLAQEWAEASNSKDFKAGEWRSMFLASSAKGGAVVGLGTLIKRAKVAGWVDPDPSQNPLIDPRQNPDARPKLTELGMAEFIAAKYSDRVMYAEDAEAWLAWDGKQWHFEKDGASINPLLKVEGRGLVRHITADMDEAGVKALTSFVARMEKASTVQAVKTLMKAEQVLRIGSGLLDAHPYLLNVDNGVLDLKTGRLLEHDPELLLTQRAYVSFDAGAECPRWERFVSEIACGDAELVRYLQCMAGYCLSGDISRHESFFMHGAGGNGKSVFVGMLRRLLGSYAATLPIDALMVRHKTGQASPDLAQLRGVRLAVTSEIARGQQLNSGVFKDLVSGDAMSVRQLYQSATMLRPVCKVVMPGNFLPTISENDHGTWRRVRVVPFSATFTGAGCDLHLEKKLASEMSGILNWCLDGFRAVQRGEMRLPAAVEKKTSDYRASLDTVQRFVEECMVQDEPGRKDGGRVKAADLYLIFKDWCVRNGYPCSSGRVFGEDMTDKVAKSRGRGGMAYLGWRVWSDVVPDSVRERWSEQEAVLTSAMAEYD